MSYPIGETKTYAKFCSAGLTSHEIIPPKGYEWLVNFFFIYHNDDNVGGIPTWWTVSDHDAGMSFQPDESVMANEMVYFPTPGALPVRFNHDVYPIARCQVEAVHSFAVMGMFIERPSQVELTLREWGASLARVPLPPGLEQLRYRIDYYRGGL